MIIPYLSTRRACAYLQISRVWMRKLVYAGRIPAYCYDESGQMRRRADGEHPMQLFFKEAELDAWKNTRTGAGRPDGAKDRGPRKPARARAR